MSEYTEQRTRRLWAAHDYVGWDRPPYPHEGAGRNIGRVVMAGPFAGFYPRGTAKWAELDATIKLKERAQNRKRFN